MRGDGARTVPLRTAMWMALGSAAFVGAFLAGVLVARAKPGPGGGTAAPLSFGGTLKQNGQPMTGKQILAFTFRKGTASCSPGSQEVDVDDDGHFVAPIALGGATDGKCSAGFFDGSDVTLEVTVQGATFTGGVSPVPYAKYAEQVGTPDCPVGYARADDANFVAPRSLCKKGQDEIVKVGSRRWVSRSCSSGPTTRPGLRFAPARRRPGSRSARTMSAPQPP